MTYFVVLWVAYACPGGWFGGFVPPAARPLVCAPRAEHAFEPRRQDALHRIAELGPGARPRLYWCRNLRCWAKDIAWRSEFEVGK